MNFHRKPYTYIGQVNLKVTDLNRSLEFYQQIIGFQVLNQTEKSAELTCTSTSGRIFLKAFS